MIFSGFAGDAVFFDSANNIGGHFLDRKNRLTPDGEE